MISTYKDIQIKVNTFNDLFDQSAQIQKIYSSSYYISLQIRIPGESKYVLVGRGHNYEGLWLSDTQVPSEIRKKDRFLEYLRKHVAGCGLLGFEMDSLDRGFCIKFSKWRRECELYIFYSGREMYFQTKIWSNKINEFEYFKSWRGKVDSEKMDFSDFDEISRKNIGIKDLVSEQKSGTKLLNDELKSAKSRGVTPKSLKFLKRKIKNISEDLKMVSNYNKIEKDIDSIEFEKLDQKTIIHDVKIKFKKQDHFNRRNETFIKIKKLKKAKEILNLRLEDTITKLDRINCDFSKSHNNLKTVEPIWKMEKSAKLEVSIDEYTILDIDGYKVAVGKSSKGNDQIRTSFASKEDWWFHLSDRPSSHIVIKGVKIVDPKIIDIIGKKYCELEKSSEVDIVYTQIKHLKAVKGKSGLVRFKKEKYFRYSK